MKTPAESKMCARVRETTYLMHASYLSILIEAWIYLVHLNTGLKYF